MAFRALVAAAAQGERQLKDALVALLLARRDVATVSAAQIRSQSQLEHMEPAGGAVRSGPDMETATIGDSDETSYTDDAEDVEDDG